MNPERVQQLLVQSVDLGTAFFHKAPGSEILARYVKSSYQDDPVRSAIELILVVFFIRYLTAASYPTKERNFVELTEAEIDELVEEWTPEPLVAPRTAFEEAANEKIPVISGPTGPKCKLDNGHVVTNLASYNFYNLAGHNHIKENAIKMLRTYGVGPCSAPQFYGTQDVHMTTEAKIASFIGTEACIIYAHALSTVTSVIPAFAKRKDVIVADKGVNFAIRKGLQVCRSDIYWYEHNNMEDLERVLQKVVRESKTLTRRFIVTEGLFETVGDTADLPKIVELKMRYKFRLILDETWSFGVLGRTGRGITESQGVDPTNVDIFVGSLSGPLSGAGGFSAGSQDVVGHQRVNSSAYTYSCAMPAMLATTAAETIGMIEENPDILIASRENIKAVRAQLARCKWVDSTGSPENPIQLLVIKPSIIKSQNLSIAEQESILQNCVDEALVGNVLITRLKSLSSIQNGTPGQKWLPQPALKESKQEAFGIAEYGLGYNSDRIFKRGPIIEILPASGSGTCVRIRKENVDIEGSYQLDN